MAAARGCGWRSHGPAGNKGSSSPPNMMWPVRSCGAGEARTGSGVGAQKASDCGGATRGCGN
jgi:hypothetical protein